MFWITISGISIALGGVVALGDTARHRLRARRRRLQRAGSAVVPITHGNWVLGDAKLAAQLFTTLCRLRNRLQSDDRPLPGVHTVLVGHDRLVLRLVDPAPYPAPSPPTGPQPAGTGSVYMRHWTLDTADARDWEPGPAPYPTLAVLGLLDGWTVLVDLARAPGIIGIEGDPDRARRFLQALGFGLACSPWSREVTIVAVGFDRPLAVPAPYRVRYIPSVAEAVARAQAAGGGPLVFLLAQLPDDGSQLEALIADPRRSVAAVCLGRAPTSRWVIEARPDGRLDLPALGLLVDQVGPGGQPLAVPPAAPAPVADRSEPIQAVTAPVLDDRVRNRLWPATIQIDLLGPLSVVAPRDPDQEFRPILTDLVAAAALHPGGLPTALMNRLLPATVDRSAVVRQLHDWLGADRAGLPRLREQQGVWRLAPDVRVDLHLFQELVSATGPEHEWPRLASALALVRGGLLADTVLGPVTGYTLARHAGAVRELVVDAARRAAGLAAGAGDPANVEWALRCGLALQPRSEALWRSLLQHRYQLDPSSVGRAADEMFAVLAAGGGRLERPTRELLSRLGLPARRRPGPARRGAS